MHWFWDSLTGAVFRARIPQKQNVRVVWGTWLRLKSTVDKECSKWFQFRWVRERTLCRCWWCCSPWKLWRCSADSQRFWGGVFQVHPTFWWCCWGFRCSLQSNLTAKQFRSGFQGWSFKSNIARIFLWWVWFNWWQTWCRLNPPCSRPLLTLCLPSGSSSGKCKRGWAWSGGR